MGISTLDNILRRLEEVMAIDIPVTYTFQTFNQRFVDECAGVFCNVVLQVPVDGICGEDFGDFNDDFNDDFLIY